jgi:CDP-diglyceride synthetase
MQRKGSDFESIRQENNQSIMAYFLIPLYVYLVYLLTQSPWGFLALNFTVSFKAHFEFSSIHCQILNCLLQGGSSSDSIHQEVLQQLIKSLTRHPFTFAISIVFHVAAIVCSTRTVGLVLSTINVLIFFTKIYQFHAFMTYNPEKRFLKHLADPNIQRDALVVTCFSLFLELFGHIYI